MCAFNSPVLFKSPEKLALHFQGQAGPLAASPATESNSKGIMTYLSPDENKAASEKNKQTKTPKSSARAFFTVTQ